MDERALAVDDALFFGGVPFGPIERPKTGSWCVGINPSVMAPRPLPSPGTRADAAAQTPTGATPRRCARSKSEARVTHRTSKGSSFNIVMFTAVADNAQLLTVGRRGDVPECDVSAPAWKKSWRRANAPQRPALASFSRGTP